MRLISTLFAAVISVTALAGDALGPFPDRVPLHTMARLEATEGDSWIWIVRRVGDSFRPDTEVVDDGRKLLVTGPPGVYEIDLIISSQGRLTQEFARLTIGDETPVPPVPPGPAPGPQPGPEPEPSDCASIADDEFGSIGRAACEALAAVTPEDMAKKAKVKAIYLDTVEAMNSPGESGVVTLLDAVRFRDSRMKAVTDQAPSWKEWGARINAHADQFISDIDRLNFGPMCAAVAKGL